MKANEFVKLVGWEYAKLNASSCPHQHYFLYNGYMEVRVADLKRLVESHELVSIYDGIDVAKDCLTVENFKRENPKHWNNLKQAIADVESCK